MNNIWAGGIVPYGIINNKIHFLLGREKYNKKWCGFIGKYEQSDLHIINTAIREFNEETAKLFEDQLSTIKNTIISGECKLIIDNNDSRIIYIWFIEFPPELFENIERKFFHNLSLMTEPQFMEKTSLKLFTIKEITNNKNQILYKLRKSILNNYNE